MIHDRQVRALRGGRAMRADSVGARSGMALITTIWWVVGALAALALAFDWTQGRVRIERRIVAAGDHFDVAEGVIAREVARIESTGWPGRWYLATPPAPGQPPGGALTGSVGDHDYTGWAQDVADFWTDPSGTLGRRMKDHVDIFLRVVGPRGRPDATRSHFFARIVFRQPSPERPDSHHIRRLTRATPHDPLQGAARSNLLTSVEVQERLRETNRPAAAVVSRAVFEAQRTEPTFTLRQIEANLDHVSLRTEIDRETAGTNWLRRGRLMLSEPSSAPATSVTTHGRFLIAVESFGHATNLARSQSAGQSRWSLPRALFALGRAEWMHGRTWPCCVPPCPPANPCMRHARMNGALARFDEIIANHPFVPDPLATDGAPTRFEAPHAMEARAMLRVAREDGVDLGALAAAQGESRTFLRDLRERYPDFHLWGAPAVTGKRRGNNTIPPVRAEDELNWFHEQLLARPLLAIGGASVRHQTSSSRVFRWVPEPGYTMGQWAEEATLIGARTGMSVQALKATSQTAGRVAGGQFLIVGGRTFAGAAAMPHAILYDPWTRTVRPIASNLAQAREGHGSAVLPDGRVILVGGSSLPVTTSSALGDCEIYDPATETFSASPAWSMASVRAEPVVTTLRDGRVLAVSGTTGEVFDAAAGTWSPLCNNLARVREGVAVADPGDGQLILAGGALPSANVTDSCELLTVNTTETRFYPGSTIPVPCPPDQVGFPAGPMTEARWHAWSVRLPPLGPSPTQIVVGGGLSGVVPETLVETPGVTYRTSVEVLEGGLSLIPRPGVVVGQTQGVGAYRRAWLLPGRNVLVTGGRAPGDPLAGNDVTEVLDFSTTPATSRLQPGLPDGIGRVQLLEAE